MAELGVTERMPYDRAILGEPETRVTWMWRLTEEGKAYSFRRASGALSVRDTARAVSSRPDDDAMDRLIEVLQGRNPMLCATIAREMGSDSYALSGLLRRACIEGKVKRFTRRGASYFMLDYREE